MARTKAQEKGDALEKAVQLIGFRRGLPAEYS